MWAPRRWHLKSGRQLLVAAGLMVCGAFLMRGEFEPWVQHTPTGPAIAALFRSVPMPRGNVPILRPPSEARPELTKLISSAPGDAMLYRLRAQEAEVALDFAAAEADWKDYAANAIDRYSARIELADFYHRQIRPQDEIAALTVAAAAKDDPLRPATAQNGWHAFERMAALVEQEALPESAAEPVFRAWVARYPKEAAAWRRLIEHLAAKKQYAAAETEIASYGRTFHDTFEPVRMRADLELRRGRADAALALYDRAFQPLWPEEMRAAYFKMLEQQGQLREFSGRARTALASNPTDLDATARLFHYFRSQNNIPAARRQLLEYRFTKEASRQPWTPDELQTLAQLFEWLPDVNEAARLYYALYSVPPVGSAQAERALDGLANLLLTSPNQPIQFGSGDLSFYKDIATIDTSPGFLNGILSLMLNGTGPRWEYQSQNEKSTAYFHRAAAAQLVALLEQRFPRSTYRAPLRAALVTAYAAYGDDATVIGAGRAYLAAFPTGAARVSVAMQVSDALARGNRTNEEFALYDQLLRELAVKASGVPIGSNAASPPIQQTEAAIPVVDDNDNGRAGLPGLIPRQFIAGAPFGRAPENPNPSGARSGEYVQVLDKYLSRLAALNRPLDALRVYRTEIDRNPNDPGLYQKMAAFLEQNGMSREVEDVYTRAIAKFGDRSWYHKLARWYLRRKETNALEKISRDAIAVFSGTELERYFGEIVSPAHPDAALYRQLNLYAHERFPEDLVFVHNLLGAYGRPGTYDGAAAARLLRQYWFYDPQLRATLFERLSQSGQLYPELAEIRAANPGIANGQFDQAVASNPAAVQFAVEAEVWFSHFEAAAPAARALASAYPGKREFTEKASALYRSLAVYFKQDTEIAVTLAGYEQRGDPRDQTILARMGDILADRELFGQARTFWERLPGTQPGKPEAYLDAATVYWDYYRYNDALRWIAAARQKVENPALYAYQAGAIYEGKRDYTSAAREYLSGALNGESAAENRLIHFLNRPQTRDLVERTTSAAIASDPSQQAVAVRIHVLEAQQRRPDLEILLRGRVELEKSPARLTGLQETAHRLGFDALEERASERLAEISNDPVDKMRLTLAHARLLESKKDTAGAASVVDAMYRQNPLILGVVRGAVDLHVRNGQPEEAIDILLEASKRARVDLAAQFTLESARIATGAGQFDRARTLLAGLLSADPLRADYLTATADTYLQAHDDRGFRDYQLATIERLKQSQLAPAERIERLATVRRSLIPALDRLKDSAGAVDQYIEVVNSYPEDEAFTKEAATYAVAHGQTGRLVAFYRKTIGDAPLDYRWPIVLGRIETATEDFPAAIADYERGIKARPDRADVVEAKAKLEERLMRFDDAIKTYGRLYELAYRDPQWMIKVAELRARTGQTSEAVSALKTAIIGARTETVDADFAIAGWLDTWHILPDAVAFADRGANLAGSDLFKEGGNAVVYARIMARARRMDAVLLHLGGNPGTDQQVIPAAGQIIADTYTPEEKASLEQALNAQAAGVPVITRNATLLPLVQSAGLANLESRWRREAMTARGQQLDQSFATLESQRGLYGDLGRQLEEYADANPGRAVEANALAQAAQAFIDEGDIEGQMRVMGKALARNELSGALLDRYLSLLASRQRDELLAVARGNGSDDVRNRAVQIAIASDRRELADAAVQARGNSLPPVWTKAYTALAGQYFDDRSPAVGAAFEAALDTRTIGDRLKTQEKKDAMISGSVWFYYGARYGEYLVSGRNPAAEAWLPASLEAAPANPGSYVALGDSYAAAGQGAKAITQFEHALELDADRGDAEDHIARVLWAEGRRPEAIARWKSAIATFLAIQGRGVKVPEPFWGRAGETFTDIGERHVLGELRSDIAHLLGDYYQRNNSYRLNELIEPAARASISSGEGTAWLVELARPMDDAEMILNSLIQAPGLTDEQRISLQRDLVAARVKRAEASFGDNREYGDDAATGARLQLVSMLLNAGDVKAASTEWSQIPTITGARLRYGDYRYRDEIEIRLASKTASLDLLLDRYRLQPESAPSVDNLRNAALVLRREGDENGARSVLEFLYDREIRSGHLEAANFLGLAEVKLQQNNTAEAIALLNRMALVVEGGFDTLLPAAQLFGKYGKATEAADFIRRRIKAAPWDSEAKVQLARTLPSATAERERLLTAAVTDERAAYQLRAEAARLAAPRPVAGVAGTELALMSSANITPDAAAKPYQLEARIEAAREATNPEVQLRLWREAVALAPFDERVRLGVLRAAITLHRDNLALALVQAGARPEMGFDEETPHRYQPYRRLRAASILPQKQLTDQERADIAESLAAAGERLDDLPTAQRYLRAAIDLRAPAQRVALTTHLNALIAEQDRRAKNTARQPLIKNVIEQDRIVRPRISRSAQ
jgi:cellulose synthase operon protein C